MNIIEIINNSSAYFIFSLAIVCFILVVVCAVLLVEIKSTKKRFDRFMRPNSKNHNVESMLIEYMDTVKSVKQANDRVGVDIADINNRLKQCVQHVGIVRYNTFEDVGGDLSYAVALLDEYNNGIIFNSLYCREGCYTYSKPILSGESRYQLSTEEQEAVDIAVNGKAKSPIKKSKEKFMRKEIQKVSDLNM